MNLEAMHGCKVCHDRTINIGRCAEHEWTWKFILWNVAFIIIAAAYLCLAFHTAASAIARQEIQKHEQSKLIGPPAPNEDGK